MMMRSGTWEQKISALVAEMARNNVGRNVVARKKGFKGFLENFAIM